VGCAMIAGDLGDVVSCSDFLDDLGSLKSMEQGSIGLSDCSSRDCGFRSLTPTPSPFKACSPLTFENFSGRAHNSKLQRLLQQVSKEHDRELQECREEIMRLKLALMEHVRDRPSTPTSPLISVGARKQAVKVELVSPLPLRTGCKASRVPADLALRRAASMTSPSTKPVLRRSGTLPTFRTPKARLRRSDSCPSLKCPQGLDTEGTCESFPCLLTEASEAAKEPVVKEEDKEKLAGATLGLVGSDPNMLLRVSFQSWHHFTRLEKTPLSFALCQQLAGIDCGEMVLSPILLRQDSNVSAYSTSAPARSTRLGRCLLISPGSNLRITWDLMGTFFLGWDIIMIPLSTFGPAQTAFMTMMEWTTLVFWTGDCVMSCLTGVVIKGVTVMEPKVVLKTYARTWFGLDVIVVVPDWVFTITAMMGDGKKGAASSGRLLRTLRFLRTVRLLRLAKLQRIFSLLKDRIDSELTFIVINIASYVIMLLMLNHFLSAMWWTVGNVGKSANGPNWVDSVGFGEDDGISYAYLTSLHWSICMFTPGSMNVQPTNVGERAFAILILIFGLVVFTAFISSMTAAIQQLKLARGNVAKDLWTLRRFLRQHGIRKELSFRILRYVDSVVLQQRNRKVSVDKVPALAFLTDQLRKEVEFEANYSCLCAHPLFENIATISKVAMFRLVGTSLSQRPLARTDILFSGGGHASLMHLLVSGELVYVKNNEMSLMSIQCAEQEIVHQDAWLCEPVLWTNWTHCGLARATASSHLVSIHSQAFLVAMNMDCQTAQLVCRYAQNFVAHLNSLGRGLLSDVSESRSTRSLAFELLNSGVDSNQRVSTRSENSSCNDLRKVGIAG